MPAAIKVDRTARDKLAEQLRHYATGSISNYTLDDKVPESPDPAVDEIFAQGVWPLYDDLHEYKRVGPDRLNPEQRKHLAQVILFLKSDLPYRWPPTLGLRFLPIRFFSLVTFGWFGAFGSINIGRRAINRSGLSSALKTSRPPRKYFPIILHLRDTKILGPALRTASSGSIWAIRG